MEEKQNSVKQLKLLIQQEQGTPRFSQALFLLPKSGKTEDASEFPMTEEQSLEGLCTVLLCVQAASIEWAKVGKGITISGEERLVIKMNEGDYIYRMGTGSVVLDGEDGRRGGAILSWS